MPLSPLFPSWTVPYSGIFASLLHNSTGVINLKGNLEAFKIKDNDGNLGLGAGAVVIHISQQTKESESVLKFLKLKNVIFLFTLIYIKKISKCEVKSGKQQTLDSFGT